jgi:predicted secreted hydrolase
MRARWWVVLAVVGLLCGVALVWWPAARARAPSRESTLSLFEVLGDRDDDERFERALTPRTFTFPADHGPHPRFRTEWWYWTGNLAAADGRRYGYQLTIFRSALAARPTDHRASAWATDQAYMAHFTVTDVAGDAFHAFERLSRDALGLAGAEGDPFAVWVLDWSAAAEGEIPRVHLRAAEGAVTIDLELSRGKPPVLQGTSGLSQKGSRPGNASYYYSLTRMPTRGVVATEGGRFAVEGASWMDREWSTSALEPGQIGWDWFALQLDDGVDVMFFQLRREDGGVDQHSHGSMVDASGRVTPFGAGDARVEVLDTWKSARSGVTYPSRFRLRVTAGTVALDLDIRPALADQELDLSFRYWEGAVVVSPHEGSPSASGRGYVELTGYDQRSLHSR